MCECAQSHVTTGTSTTGFFFSRTWKKLANGNCYTTDWQTHTHIYIYIYIYMWRYKCRRLSNCFIVGYVFYIDIVAWFTWIGELTAIRMLFNRNDSYRHIIISKILNNFLFNFLNWCFLRETCAYPHFLKWKNHECCLPLNIFSSWVFGFGPAQACILSLRTIRCQHTNPFWTPDPDQVTLIPWRSDGVSWHSRARADSTTHSRLTGIGLWGIDEMYAFV